MFTKDDIDRMRNVRNYTADADWIESVVVRMEAVRSTAAELDADIEADVAEMIEEIKKPKAKKAVKKAK